MGFVTAVLSSCLYFANLALNALVREHLCLHPAWTSEAARVPLLLRQKGAGGVMLLLGASFGIVCPTGA